MPVSLRTVKLVGVARVVNIDDFRNEIVHTSMAIFDVTNH